MADYSEHQYEIIDSVTNELMDIIREQCDIDSDSDKDDEIYGYVQSSVISILERFHLI